MTSLAIGRDGDLVLEEGSLVEDRTLSSAILVSLLCDRRAENRRPEANRGYWADDPADRIGSLLWTLDRGKATEATAAAARDHAARALEWLTTERIAARVEIDATVGPIGVLELEITVERGTAPRWASAWDALEDLEHPWEGGRLRVRVV